MLSPWLRNLALTAHVTTSIGWFGAVAGFLALAVPGLVSEDAETVRSAYVAMELTAWLAIVPMALSSFLTGVISSLGTPWGLFRHYWVLVKLLITVFATVILLLQREPIGHLADVAAESGIAAGDLLAERIAGTVHAGAALFVLVVLIVLSVYKPAGRTPFSREI